MSTLTINHLDPATTAALKGRASENGRSLEAEARQILSDAVDRGSSHAKAQIGLAEAIRRRFSPLGGVDELVPPPREYAGDRPTFDP